MIVERVIVGEFQANTWLIGCERTGKLAVIDPGAQAGKIRSALERLILRDGIEPELRYLLMTHGHLDHIGAVRDVCEWSHLKRRPLIGLNPADEFLYRQLRMQGSCFGLSFDDPLPVDFALEPVEPFKIGELDVRVIHTPGHSPGGVCFLIHDPGEQKLALFSGDTLFEGSIGRTDLWGGDIVALKSSIRSQLFSLPDDVRVFPGHGAETTIGAEKRDNPFLKD